MGNFFILKSNTPIIISHIRALCRLLDGICFCFRWVKIRKKLHNIYPKNPELKKNCLAAADGRWIAALRDRRASHAHGTQKGGPTKSANPKTQFPQLGPPFLDTRVLSVLKNTSRVQLSIRMTSHKVIIKCY